jgi:hypothetical protein
MLGEVFNRYAYTYADGASGSITLDVPCQGQVQRDCGWLQESHRAQVVIEVLSQNAAILVTANGLTQPIQVSWRYLYVFGGLILQPGGTLQP